MTHFPGAVSRRVAAAALGVLVVPAVAQPKLVSELPTYVFDPAAGEFTLRFAACVGEQCSAPDPSGSFLNDRKGWSTLSLIHAKAGLEAYVDGNEVVPELATQNPYFIGALMIGLGFARTPRSSQLVHDGYKLIISRLKGGNLAETVIYRGVHRDLIQREYRELQARRSVHSLF